MSLGNFDMDRKVAVVNGSTRSSPVAISFLVFTVTGNLIARQGRCSRKGIAFEIAV